MVRRSVNYWNGIRQMVTCEQVGILVHLDPPVAHTVNIEPLTPGDWESMNLRLRDSLVS